MAPSPSHAASGLAPNQRMAIAAAPSSQEKIERFAGRDLAGDQRPVLRAVHELVDVAVDVTVEGAGGACRERAAHQRRQDQADRREAAFGIDHGGQRADEQELDDAGFRERQVGLGFAAEAHSSRGRGGVQRRISCAHGGSHSVLSGCAVLSGWAAPGGFRNASCCRPGSALGAHPCLCPSRRPPPIIPWRSGRHGPPNSAHDSGVLTPAHRPATAAVIHISEIRSIW